MLFFTSDLHFGHTNIISYCNRPFSNVAEMDAALIANWNHVVAPEDTVWVLGDFCFGPREQWAPRIAQLNGIINLVLGNHDHKPTYLAMHRVKTCVKSEYWVDDHGEIYLLHHYPPGRQKNQVDSASYSVALCGHVHDAWRDRMIGGRPVINVGVDQWGYTPVSEVQIRTLLGVR